MTYQIISDGSCDLPSELTKEKQIHVVPFYVSFDDTHYYREMEEINVRDFYQEMVDKDGIYPKTSLPSVQDYFDVFQSYAARQIPMICICITQKFSGSFGAAENAKELILEQYPDAQITVIDAQVNTVLQGIYVLEACRMRDAGFASHVFLPSAAPAASFSPWATSTICGTADASASLPGLPARFSA